MPDTSAPPAMFTRAEIAKLLNCTTTHVTNMTTDGRMPPPVRLSTRFVRWPRAVILDWIAAGCPPHRSPDSGG